MVQIENLPASGQQVLVWWRKLGLVCSVVGSSRVSFTEKTAAG